MEILIIWKPARRLWTDEIADLKLAELKRCFNCLLKAIIPVHVDIQPVFANYVANSHIMLCFARQKNSVAKMATRNVKMGVKKYKFSSNNRVIGKIIFSCTPLFLWCRNGNDNNNIPVKGIFDSGSNMSYATDDVVK